VTGSLIVFAVQFVASLLFGRGFCGWLCPTGALQEIVMPIRPKPLRRRWITRIKYVVWGGWFGFLVYGFAAGSGEVHVEPGYMTTGGVSIGDPTAYIVYYAVLSVFLVLALTIGRRGGCHALCWMAPFMTAGRAIRNRLRLPALVLEADPCSCIRCERCTAACPMSLHVSRLAERTVIDHVDCILCGECADVCPRGVLSFRFASLAARDTGRRTEYRRRDEIDQRSRSSRLAGD
jgi:polyferredoxin